MKKIVLRDYSSIEKENKEYCEKIQEYINNYQHNIVVLKDELEEDKRKKPKIFDDKCEYTKSYVGVIKGNVEIDGKSENVTIHINSRFDKKGEYKFLNYVFSKAFDSSGRIFENMDNESSDDSTWDSLLMILYVKQLEDALRQGNFRQYITYEYNDSKVKGKIDISKHIKLNPIENGKIAYSTREYTIDNPINHLILQAYECLSKRYGEEFKKLIRDNKIVKDGISNLKMNIPDLNKYNKKILLNKVSKPIYHSVYIKYEQLRKTSISIIRRLELNIFDDCDQEVQGILIPMDKLWEKFLHSVIFTNEEIENYKNESKGKYKQKSIGILYKEVVNDDDIKSKDYKMNIKPDFYIDNSKSNDGKKRSAVFDAKYKNGWGEVYLNDKSWSDYVREDAYQVISYMGILNADVGGVIFPINKHQLKGNNKTFDKNNIVYDDGFIVSDIFNKTFYTIPYYIEDTTSIEFEKNMKEQEEKIVKAILRWINQEN